MKNEIKREPSVYSEGLSLYISRSTEAKKKIKDNRFNNGKRFTVEFDVSRVEEELEKEMQDKLKHFIKTNYSLETRIIMNGLLMESSLTKNKYKNRKFTKQIRKEFDSVTSKSIIDKYSLIKSETASDMACMTISTNPLDFINMGQGQDWKTCYGETGSFNTSSYCIGLDEFSFLIYISSDPEKPCCKTYRRIGTYSKDYESVMLSPSYPYSSKFIDGEILKLLRLEDIETTTKKDSVVFTSLAEGQMFYDFTSPLTNGFLFIRKPQDSNVFSMGKIMFCLNCLKRAAKKESPICEICHKEKGR